MNIRCDCGGTMKAARLVHFDLTDYLGVKATVDKVRGLRCDRCGWETLPGAMINLALDAVAIMVIGLEGRLPGELARYLRNYIGLTQQELAKRMGIARKTVNQWETGDPISPQHDFILRTLVYVHFSDAVRPQAMPGLDHVRVAPPRARVPRLIVPELRAA